MLSQDNIIQIQDIDDEWMKRKARSHLKMLYVYSNEIRRSPIYLVVRTKRVYLEVQGNLIIISPTSHFRLSERASNLIWAKVFNVLLYLGSGLSQGSCEAFPLEVETLATMETSKS